MLMPEKTEGPVCRDLIDLRLRKHRRAAVGEACDVRARKDRRAGLQGRNRLASPQTSQCLLSGKHAMPVPEKIKGPVRRDANELGPRKLRRACCRGSMRCPCPKRPKGRLAGTQTNCGLFSNKVKHHFAARTQIAAQTPICSPNANLCRLPVCSSNANLHT